MDQFGSFGLISSQTSADGLLMDDIEKQLVELEAITTMESQPEPEPEALRQGDGEREIAENANKVHETVSQPTAPPTLHPLNLLNDKKSRNCMDKENVSVNQVPMVGRKKLLITKNSASFGKDCQRGPNPKSSPLSTQVVHAPLSAQDNPQQTETSLKKGDTQSEHQNEGEKVVETQQEPKRNLTAFMHYLNMNRQAIKDKHPGMTNPEASRVIGQQWKQLSPHERAHYEAIAAEDKARYLKEVASTRQKVPFDSETRGRKGKAFELFCIERQGSDDPKRSVKEQKKALAAEWNALSPEQRAMYKKMSVESEKNDKKRERAATLSKKVVSKISEKDQKKRKTSQGTVLKEGANTSDTRDAKNKSVDHHLDHVDNVDAAEEAGEEEEEEVEDDVDRENVDWTTHPAEAIISKTKTHYIVARKGLPLYEFGAVPIAMANSQRRECREAGTDQNSMMKNLDTPLTVSQINEYETFVKTYKRDTLVCADGCELDLDNLPAGNLLETCSFLGLMRSPGHELHKPAGKDDVFMKVPLMATCRLVQRLLEVERSKSQKYLAMISDLQKRLEECGGMCTTPSDGK